MHDRICGLTLGRHGRRRNGASSTEHASGRGSSPDEPDDTPRARSFQIVDCDAYCHPGVTHEEQSLDDEDDDEESSSSSEEDEEPTRRKRGKKSKQERRLARRLRIVLMPRIQDIKGPKLLWAELSAKADDPSCNFKYKEFRWLIRDILQSQGHSWQIP